MALNVERRGWASYKNHMMIYIYIIHSYGILEYAIYIYVYYIYIHMYWCGVVRFSLDFKHVLCETMAPYTKMISNQPTDFSRVNKPWQSEIDIRGNANSELENP